MNEELQRKIQLLVSHNPKLFESYMRRSWVMQTGHRWSNASFRALVITKVVGRWLGGPFNFERLFCVPAWIIGFVTGETTLVWLALFAFWLFMGLARIWKRLNHLEPHVSMSIVPVMRDKYRNDN